MKPELLYLIAIVAALYVVTWAIYKPMLAVFRVVEYALLSISVMLILFLLFYVSMEVIRRYGFNSPQPGHLELSELIILGVVFLAISYTQRTHGHVGMDLFLEALPAGGRRVAVMASLIVSSLVCAVIGWFSIKNAYTFWLYDDVTMTEPYFKTWYWAGMIGLGYCMTCLRMIAQFMSLLDPERFPDDTPVDDSGLHAGSD
ncbi:MAG: TRAP transporter small permease [Hyphomicrobiaceae bacterium]